MQQILEAIGVLFIMFLVLRVSLAQRGKGHGLRGGQTFLNLTTGALAGTVAGVILREIGSTGVPVSGLEESGYAVLAAALRALLPLAGAAFGGIVGYFLLGSVWRRLGQGEPGAAPVWMRRAQIAVATAGLAFLLFHLLA